MSSKKQLKPKRQPLSERRRAALYDALNSPMQEFRIRERDYLAPEQQNMLADLVHEIWRAQCRVLGIKQP